MSCCECGCGQLTRIIPKNNTAKGYLKGERFRFVRGHQHLNIIPSGYKTIGSRGAHKVLAERALGKPLPLRAVVHHVDRDIGSRTPRIIICQDQAYHRLLHFRMRIKAAGGNPNTEKICTGCRMVKAKTEFSVNLDRASDGLSIYCWTCSRTKNNHDYAVKVLVRDGRPVRHCVRHSEAAQ